MKLVTENRFDGGIAESRFGRFVGECGYSKHFDLVSFPNMLVPYRGVSADTTGQTGIASMIVDSRGHVFGLGKDGSNHGQLYKKNTTASAWTTMTNGATGALQTIFTLLVEFADFIYIEYPSGIAYIDQSDSAGISTHALAHTTMANGVVHPATGYLYVGYDNKIWQKTTGGSVTTAALTLPSNATVTCITPFGNYLAIAATIGSSSAPQSKLFLWDLTSTTWNEAIPWGSEYLQLVNVLNGVLIGISITDNSGNILDRNSIFLKSYSVGGVPTYIKELSTEKQTSTQPSSQINAAVNFIFKDKLYFSVDLVGGSTSPALYGLWSLSHNRTSGRYSVTIERQATNDNSETSVLAAAIIGDYCFLAHTSAGTLTRTNSTASINSTSYAATSVYETVVNPNMPEGDYGLKKKLMSVRAAFYLPDSTSQVVVKYRIDRATSWTTVFTKTAASPNTDTTGYQSAAITGGIGRYLEFRIESIGGAEITGFSYSYDVLPD